VGTVFTLIVTALCAYPLSKPWITGRKFFMMLFVFTMFFGGGLIPNFVLISRLGLVNKIWALVLPGAFNQIYIILALGSMQGLPPELEESAALDGLNPWQTLLRIVLPLSKPIFATVALFTALGIWNDWFNPMLYLNSNEKYPVMLLLKNIITGGEITTGNFTAMGPNTNINAASLKSAAIILVMAPITAIYPFVQRYFVKGMLIGSLKG
jgi:putative aldouronate transport system permease protein